MIFLAPHARKAAAPVEIIRDGLVSRWPYDDGTGSSIARDDQGTNTGTLNGMDPQTAWVEGRLGGDVALQFNGGERVDVAHADELNQINLSWCIWVKQNANPAAWSGVLGRTNSGWTVGYGVYLNSGRVYFFYGGYSRAASAALPAADRDWHLVIATYDGTTKRIYLDNVEGTPNSQADSPQMVTLDLALGFMTGGAYFVGVQQDARFYQRVLNASERTAIFNGTG